MGLLDRDYMRAAPRWHAGELGAVAPPARGRRPARTRARCDARGLWTMLVAAAVWLVLGFIALAVLSRTTPESAWGPLGTAVLVTCAIVAVVLARRLMPSRFRAP